MDSSKEQLDFRHLVQAALSIAARRREILLQLRKALEANDVQEAIKLAKELCGLNDKERY